MTSHQFNRVETSVHYTVRPTEKLKYKMVGEKQKIKLDLKNFLKICLFIT